MFTGLIIYYLLYSVNTVEAIHWLEPTNYASLSKVEEQTKTLEEFATPKDPTGLKRKNKGQKKVDDAETSAGPCTTTKPSPRMLEKDSTSTIPAKYLVDDDNQLLPRNLASTTPAKYACDDDNISLRMKYADAAYNVWIATTTAPMNLERRTNIQMSTHLQQQNLQRLASLQWLDNSGESNQLRNNSSPYPTPTRLMSTTAVQHELRDATQTQPGLEPLPKAQPRGLSSTPNVMGKPMPYA